MDYNVTLTNPGAESASTTGWTLVTGTFTSNTASGSLLPHSGSRYFKLTGLTGTNEFYQDVAIPAGAIAGIDAGTASVRGSVYRTSRNYTANIYLNFYDAGAVLLGTIATTRTEAFNVYILDVARGVIPVGTRTIRVGATSVKQIGAAESMFDDFSLVVSDSAEGYINQGVVYAICTQPAAYIGVTQAPLLVVSSGQTDLGNYKLNIQQAVMYALVKKHGDKRKLRAWRFPQDEHEFYVLQLGNSNGTYVYDTLTDQWCKWKSPTEAFWRGEDGCDWEGFNVCCDTNSGKIFKIDPTGRLDYNDTTDSEDTPITSVVVGGMTQRFRTNVPCYMGEVAISEGQPPNGIDASTVGLSLRSGDTLGWYDHGTLTGLPTGDRLTVRWYGLGLMAYPGRVFEITDTGYARRIDGFNIELGGYGGNQ